MNLRRTQKIVRFSWILFLVMPTIVAICWAVYPAASTLTAVMKAPESEFSKNEVQDVKRILEFQRELQKHFLGFDLYIPIEDIVVFPAKQQEGSKDMALMQKACGNSNVYVWVPFRFRLPMVGDHVVEWCWKPDVKLF